MSDIQCCHQIKILTGQIPGPEGDVTPEAKEALNETKKYRDEIFEVKDGLTDTILQATTDIKNAGDEAVSNVEGLVQQAAESAQDAKDWGSIHGLWVIDDAGGLMPTSSSFTTEDDSWELDENGDVMPKEQG